MEHYLGGKNAKKKTKISHSRLNQDLSYLIHMLCPCSISALLIEVPRRLNFNEALEIAIPG